MAKYGSADVGFFLVHGYDVLGVTTEINEEHEAVSEESHGFGVAWPEHTSVGVQKAMITQNGFYDDDAASVNAALVGNVGLSRVVMLAHSGNVIGRRFLGLAGQSIVKYARILTLNLLHKANATYMANGQRDEGILLHAHTADTGASGNTQGSSVDNGASSANGGAGYVAVSALTLGGYTSVSLYVRHSTDNISFSDLVTFANVTAAPAAERLTVAGTVNRYLATRYAFNGAGSGQSVTWACGFNRF